MPLSREECMNLQRVSVKDVIAATERRVLYFQLFEFANTVDRILHGLASYRVEKPGHLLLHFSSEGTGLQRVFNLSGYQEYWFLRYVCI